MPLLALPWSRRGERASESGAWSILQYKSRHNDDKTHRSPPHLAAVPQFSHPRCPLLETRTSSNPRAKITHPAPCTLITLSPAPRTTTTGPTRHLERMNYHRDAMQISRESEPTSAHPTAIEVMNLSDIPELRKITLAPTS